MRMKTIVFPLFLFLLLLLPSGLLASESWYKRWTVNGVPVEKLLHSSPQERLHATAGIVASATTHWLGHVLWLESTGTQWEQRGLTEKILEPLSDTEALITGLSGLTLQLTVGLMLPDSTFRRAFTTYTHLQLMTYPALHRNASDFRTAGREISPDVLWTAFTFTSGLIRSLQMSKPILRQTRDKLRVLELDYIEAFDTALPRENARPWHLDTHSTILSRRHEEHLLWGKLRYVRKRRK